MSSRVEGPRSGAPIGVGRHKQDNERRNQELQKRAIDGPLTKSLTEDPNTRARARKKDPMAGKSFMKATSSSSLKKSLESRDVSPSKGKRRDSSPPKVMSKSDHSVELRRSTSRKSVDNSNRLSVFERLSKSDSNKESIKADVQLSKGSDRKVNDKNSVKRKSGVFSDTSVQSVPLRRDSNVRRSSRANGKRDSKSEISEKHKGEEKPESSDKDAKEECSTVIKPRQHESQEHVSLAPSARQHVGPATTTAHQAPTGALMGAAAAEAGDDGTEGAVVVAHSNAAAMPTATAPATAVVKACPDTSPAPPNHSQQHPKRPAATTPKDGPQKASTMAAAPGGNKPKRKDTTPKPEPASGTHPAKMKKSPSSDLCKPPKSKSPKSPAVVDTKASSPSVAAVTRLAERVITGQVKPNKGDDSKVMDDDKDVCDDDKASEDREFYRIKVQTRLVSYENNTLVIKNTSPVQNAEEEEETGDPEQCHDESCSAGTDTSSVNSLQTSSAEASPMGGSEEELGEGGFTRSRSLRLKMSNFMNKGKNFFSDVYSTTQQSLQPHLDQLPEMTRSFHQKMSRSMSSECSSLDALSLMSFSSISLPDDRGDTSNNLPVTDTDSGYYSIHTPREQVHTPQPDTELDDQTENVKDSDILTNFTGEEVTSAPMQTECSSQNLHNEDTVDGSTVPENLINDDWIKRCIVNCSCQCRGHNKDLDSPSAGSLDSGHGSDASIDTAVSDASQELDLVTPHVDGTSGGTATAPPSGGDTGSSQGECQCECHSTTPVIHDQVPQEVIDLLDVDHARMWWTITGNFGNILPIDWSKTYTRQQYLPVLNLNETKDVCNNSSDEGEGGEEEEVAQDLDLHHLILSGLNDEPVKSAEEVIREIDDIMQEGSSSSEDEGLEETMSCSTETQSTQPEMRPLPPPLYEEKLKNLSVNELNEHYMELETVIRQYSETLINQLALRDELEYEKELKNSFISLLLQVQNKRRNFNVEKKQKKKYLTTVIPYDVGHGPPSNQTLQILIKILTAINEDSPTVPTLLTDYILKVLCPS